ncbi:protein sym-1 [Phalaenopsis equestris]|uniref:protein sym-1 n=1 Tax=Phalaenopsis equestris TaxID=78828 RepID=UPI0009E5A3E1|nr:protein sym-1 [Phalaenopsis equestris]
MMLWRGSKIAAMLLRSPIAFESLQPLSAISSNFHNICRITSIPVPQTLPRFRIPIGCFQSPTVGACSRVWGSVYSRSDRKGFDFFMLQAVLDRGSGGGDGFKGSGGGGSGGGGGEEAGGNGWSFLSWYLAALDKHPVITKALTSAFLTLIGDLVCQIMIDHVPKLDERRTFVFTFLGLVLVGPTLHFWYLSLSKLISLPGASGASLRLFLDQFFFSPIFIGVFLCALVTLEGRPSQVIPKLQQEWFSSVLANWQLWIPFQFLNFRFVPQKFQVLAANVVALVWNVILSFKAHKEIVVK